MDSAIEGKARFFADMSGEDVDYFSINNFSWLEIFKQKIGITTSSCVLSQSAANFRGMDHRWGSSREMSNTQVATPESLSGNWGPPTNPPL